MKPTFFRTFSLRSLLVLVTLVALGFGFVAENWRQQKLVDYVLRASNSEGTYPLAHGDSDGSVSMCLAWSWRLSPDTARKIVEAKRIAWITTDRGTSPDVHGILAKGFVEQPVVLPGVVSNRQQSIWYRKGTTVRRGNVWFYLDGYKQKPRPVGFLPWQIWGPPESIYDWPVIDLVFWPYKKHIVFGVAGIVVGFVGWMLVRVWAVKKGGPKVNML